MKKSLKADQRPKCLKQVIKVRTVFIKFLIISEYVKGVKFVVKHSTPVCELISQRSCIDLNVNNKDWITFKPSYIISIEGK